MKKLWLIISIIISLIVLRINFKLHSENFSINEQKEDIVKQLNFIEDELKTNNLDIRMQKLFPEGYVFINALYGLSWCELALSNKSDSSLKNKAILEALYAYNRIDHNRAKWTFPKQLIPKYGIFYNGWRNYLLSKIMMIDTSFRKSDLYIDLFKNQCTDIHQAIKESDYNFLESYHEACWPADMFVAMASLANHDKIFSSEYESEIDKWLKGVSLLTDPKTSMVPHKVEAKTDILLDGARGCSMALILRMLADIEPNLGREQYNLFKETFISKTLGLPSVREYPKGINRKGDIDSGPVIFGVGFTATIMMIGPFSIYDNIETAENQYKTVHAFGFNRTNKTKKKYLYGALPMADAFIAWGRATNLNYHETDSNPERTWLLSFKLTSLMVLFFFWSIYFRRIIVAKIQNRNT